MRIRLTAIECLVSINGYVADADWKQDNKTLGSMLKNKLFNPVEMIEK